MQRSKTFWWITVGSLAFVATAGGVSPYALAEIRTALVRDLDSPVRGIRHPLRFTTTFPNGFTVNDSTVVPLSIPAGKKFFLQSISMRTLLTDSQNPIETRVIINSRESTVFTLDQHFQGQDIQRFFAANLEMNVLLGGNDNVQIFIRRDNNLGDSDRNFADGSLNGYLVDKNPDDDDRKW
jgi:hypothetical protein